MPHATVPEIHRKNARRMRRAMTEAELKFWNAVRAHRLMGLGFRRQLPVAGFIVDFACPEYHLIVEIDGSQHGDDLDVVRDALRTEWLEQAGWTVVRFWNDEVLRDIDGACAHVLAVIEEKSPGMFVTPAER
ncbi:endonuclease domain-containing protein [Jiella endophytica]|uniref:Endonuclease domain-containing protein n=2 Tax=Jiella endophytica TaxID=2558362 RepID=A0A4Y8RHF0_9HYPH|nr:DUF559 domain-containing protein [Jiella endophytica]TFF21846.1 endonuclease domain-containing protein [Jiella endophytica]